MYEAEKTLIDSEQELSCHDCIHEWACSMQCGGNVMANGNAMRCACYEDVKGSTAYFIGFMDGKKAQGMAVKHRRGRMYE